MMWFTLPQCVQGAVYATHLALQVYSGQVPLWSENPILTMVPEVYVDFDPGPGQVLLVKTDC